MWFFIKAGTHIRKLVNLSSHCCEWAVKWEKPFDTDTRVTQTSISQPHSNLEQLWSAHVLALGKQRLDHTFFFFLNLFDCLFIFSLAYPYSPYWRGYQVMPAGSSSQTTHWGASLLTAGSAGWENAQNHNAAHRLCEASSYFLCKPCPFTAEVQLCRCSSLDKHWAWQTASFWPDVFNGPLFFTPDSVSLSCFFPFLFPPATPPGLPLSLACLPDQSW